MEASSGADPLWLNLKNSRVLGQPTLARPPDLTFDCQNDSAHHHDDRLQGICVYHSGQAPCREQGCWISVPSLSQESLSDQHHLLVGLLSLVMGKLCTKVPKRLAI